MNLQLIIFLLSTIVLEPFLSLNLLDFMKVEAISYFYKNLEKKKRVGRKRRCKVYGGCGDINLGDDGLS